MSHSGDVKFVRYGFRIADLFLDEPNRYDDEASAQKYANQCKDELTRRYPGAEIEVLIDSGVETLVLREEHQEMELETLPDNDDRPLEIPDLDEAEFIDQLLFQEILQAYKWEVPRPWLTIEKAHGRFDIPVPVIRWMCQQGLIEEVEKTHRCWEFPQDVFVEATSNHTLANCEVLGIGAADFECYPESVLDAVHFPAGVESLLVIPTEPEILWFSDDCNLLLSRRETQMSIVFEHFWGEKPWTAALWSYDTCVKELVSQARQHEAVESELDEDKHAGKSFVQGVRLVFVYDYEPPYTLREFINQALNTLNDIIRETEIRLSGGPVWREEYEKYEIPFCKEILAPLLRKMGFEFVRYFGGRKEYGKDFVFSEQTKFGKWRHYGLQAKAGHISGRVGANIDKLLEQIKRAFTMSYSDIGSEAPKHIAVFIIATSGYFTENAQEIIAQQMPNVVRGSVYLWDKDDILSLITKHWTNSE